MSYLSDLRTVSFTDDNGKARTLVGASFRGLSFFVASYQYGTGRRIAVHEFPGVDDPFNEDMGRATRSVTFEAYLLGDGVHAQLSALLEALETAGPGKLVHPRRGTLNARCSAVNVQESSTEKRRVALSLTFALDPDVKETPVSTVDLKTVSRLQSATAKAAVAAKFEKDFSLLDAARSTVDAAVKLSDKLLTSVESARESMRKASAYVSKVAQVRQNLELLLMTPGDFAARIQELITSAEGAVLPSGASSSRRSTAFVGATTTTTEEDTAAALARAQLSEALTMADAGSDVAAVPNPTASERRIQAANQAALLQLFRASAAFDLGDKLVGAEITSVEDAGTLQESMAAAFETILQTAEDPEIYQLAQDSQASALGYLRETSADLAVVLSMTPARTVPSLVLAFELYGDHERAPDLVTRNGIPHPGFLQGGQALEVLSK